MKENSRKETTCSSLSFDPTLRDKLSWFSPQTVWGILRLQDASSFTDFQLQNLINGVLGMLLPLLLLSLLREAAQIGTERLVAATLVSPWNIACAATVISEVRTVQKTCSNWRAMRKPLDDDARNTLQRRIQGCRAQRFPRFDVYFPVEYRGQALLFFPGACVPHAAYSEVASLMSDDGIVVVVVSMEPVCMPSSGLGADAQRMRQIIEYVDNNLLPPLPPPHWSLGGHSFGAFAAMRLALELDPACVVLWGMGPFPDAFTDISTLEHCPILLVQGSNDAMTKYSREEWQTLLQLLPPGSVRTVIRGGTHNGFATYFNNPTVDGVPGITKKKQHRLVAQATSSFIFRHTKGRRH